MAKYKGTKGNDLLNGAEEDDLIIGNGGNDVFHGGNGNDQINAGAGADQLFGDAGNDKLVGAGGDDMLDGGVGDDELDGGDGNDSILGGAGFDMLIGGAGNDTLDGGTDDDVAIYLAALSGMIVDLTILGPQNTVGAGIDTLTNIEHLVGSPFDDHLIGNAATNLLQDGGGGNDILDGGAALNDIASYFFATSGVYVNLNLVGADPNLNPTVDPMGILTGAGDDILINIETTAGSNFADTLIGNNLLNIMSGRAGDDTIFGMGGNDVFDPAQGNDSVDGGIGIDGVIYGISVSPLTLAISASTNSFTIDLAFYDATTGKGEGPDTGLDTLISIENATTSAGNDTIWGSAVGNSISPGAGNDFADGRAGTDTLSYSIVSFGGITTGVYVNLNLQGEDPNLNPTIDPNGILVGAGDDIIMNFENVTGSDFFDDVLIGDGKANVIQSVAGNDTIFGGAGNDILVGGVGDDLVTGEAGVDTFGFNMVNNAGNLGKVANDADTVTDLTSVDIVSFQGVFNVDGLGGINEADLDAGSTFNTVTNVDGGIANDTIVNFNGGGSITFLDITFTSFAALEALNGAANNVVVNGV